MTQNFQFITLRGRIRTFKPFNPFPDSFIEQINNFPIEKQLQFIHDTLVAAQSGAHIEVVDVNAEYDVVLYNLVLAVSV